MNAVVLAEGYLEGGRDGARKSLARFWQSISDAGAFSPFERKLFDTFFSSPLQSMATQWWADFIIHFASPYDFNPLNINPLRDHLDKTVDFAKVRVLKELKLFVAATNAKTGRIKVFEGPELTADHVMASACLPYLLQAVESTLLGWRLHGQSRPVSVVLQNRLSRYCHCLDQSDRAGHGAPFGTRNPRGSSIRENCHVMNTCVSSCTGSTADAISNPFRPPRNSTPPGP